MAESTSRKWKKREDGPRPRPRGTVIVKGGVSGKNRKSGENEPAKLDRKSSEDGPVKLEAKSSTAESAGTKWKRFADELNRHRHRQMRMSGVGSVCDVVLSFIGTDVGSGIAGSLYGRLVADGIRVFRYDGTLNTPTAELQLSVYSSKIYVPIFSRNYAGSSQCLEALALMVEHASTSGGKKEIWPIFYDVDRYSPEKKSLYTKDLYKQRQMWGTEKIERWKHALVEAGKVRGSELIRGDGSELDPTHIAEEISDKLNRKHHHVTKYLSEAEDVFTGPETMLSLIFPVYFFAPIFLSSLVFSSGFYLLMKLLSA